MSGVPTGTLPKSTVVLSTEMAGPGGALPPDFKAFALRKVHGLLSRLAMALIALHVLAALYHQFILRDRLLPRMGLGKP